MKIDFILTNSIMEFVFDLTCEKNILQWNCITRKSDTQTFKNTVLFKPYTLENRKP